jgi:hypothetical protein
MYTVVPVDWARFARHVAWDSTVIRRFVGIKAALLLRRPAAPHPTATGHIQEAHLVLPNRTVI